MIPVSEATERPHLLLVDDEPQMLLMYQRILRGMNCVILTASNGLEALKLFETHTIDVVVSDINMPGMDGLALLEAIRGKGSDVPCILVTAGATTHSAMHAVTHRALRYLEKPVSRETLTGCVNDALDLRRSSSRKRKAAQVFGNDEQRLQDRENLESVFASALARLSMVFQPLVRVSDGKVTTFAYEALVRSSEPRMNNPGLLFDAAEKLDGVEAIGRAVRNLVTRASPNAPADAQLFVNLHAKDLSDPTLFSPDSELSKIASRVVLEITERATLHDMEHIVERIAPLRALGYRIAIDDIGAGYSGLTSFAMLEPDFIKIDMGLVRGLDTRPRKQKVVRSLLMLAADLGVGVVAEGVETKEERDVLLGMGCTAFQGYFFGRPAPNF